MTPHTKVLLDELQDRFMMQSGDPSLDKEDFLMVAKTFWNSDKYHFRYVGIPDPEEFAGSSSTKEDAWWATHRTP